MIEPNYKLLLKKDREELISKFEKKIISLFENKSDSQLLNDPFFGLINVNECDFGNDYETFKYNFDIITEHIFETFDMNNMIIIGDTILRALLNNSNKDRFYYHNDGTNGTIDIDIYFYNMNLNEVDKKYNKLVNHLKKYIPYELKFTNYENYIAINSNFPYQTINIMKTIYKSPSELLHNVSIDCEGICYNKKKLKCSTRCALSIMKKKNIVNLNRYESNYEEKLLKYHNLGFEYDYSNYNIDENIFSKINISCDYSGLAKLKYPINNKISESSNQNIDSIDWTYDKKIYKITIEDWINDLVISENDKAFFSSIINDSLEINDKIINKCDFAGRTPLQLAILFNSKKSFDILINKNSLCDTNTIFSAIQNNYIFEYDISNIYDNYNLGIEEYEILFRDKISYNNLKLSFFANYKPVPKNNLDLYIKIPSLLDILIDNNINLTETNIINYLVDESKYTTLKRILDKKLIDNLHEYYDFLIETYNYELISLVHTHLTHFNYESYKTKINNRIVEIKRELNDESYSFVQAFQNYNYFNRNKSYESLRKELSSLIELKKILYDDDNLLKIENSNKFDVSQIKFFDDQGEKENTKQYLRLYGGLWNGNLEIVKTLGELLTHSLKTNNGWSPLDVILIRNDETILNYILDNYEYEITDKHVQIVLVNDSYECFKILYERKQFKNLKKIYMKCIEMKKYNYAIEIISELENLEKLLSYIDTKNLFYGLKKIDNINLKVLIRNLYDESNLSLDTFKIVKSFDMKDNLIENSIDILVNIPKILEFILENECIPINMIKYCYNVNSLKILIENDLIDSTSLLEECKMCKSYEFIKMYQEYKKEEESITDKEGNTALHYAFKNIMNKSYKVLEYHKIENSNGDIPLEILIKNIKKQIKDNKYDIELFEMIKVYKKYRKIEIDRIYYKS
ncbi:MAG: hypothetical protein CMF62_03340 [Magnetococcales bacterium]|nr:hypothetical protein [Magnetococcales bacterium]|tara:strand:+ start:10120 stop:12873 length:2754 start_codon:yes stop_codon:yes gene_type:complete